MGAKVLFVCVENSCRSQMAEGFARKLGLEAWSAGSRPSGKVNATAVALMKEKGVDLSVHASKGLAELPAHAWDYVITMGCGDACPLVPAKAKLDWDLPDPKGLPLPEFRKVRDEIERKVTELLARTRE
ncbi:MAG: arsenate reductase ArsC [Elusimicrobia bacterium]|nr:arsenate reductase ArsC [Elusimicrobiota bacterium]